MISIENLSVEFGVKPLFTDVSYVINRHDRIALVGKNGAGKSTMLKIILGMQQPTHGRVSKPKGLSMGYLPQVMNLADTMTVRQETEKAFASTIALEERLAEMNRELETRTDYESQSYADLIDSMTELNEQLTVIQSQNRDAEIERTLMGLGFERKDAIDSYNGDEEAAATWMNYEERVTGSVLYNSDGFVCYQYNIYSYAGGAHGNTQIRNCVFDCKLKRSLALCDIFSAESYPLVSQKIRQQLMKQYDCASLDELSGKSFFDPEKISVTENFLIDEDGMSWLFDPYEIAAYAMGEISVRLSWHDLKPLILEESPLYDLADQYDV